MSRKPIFWYIRQLKRPVFTTHELAAVSGRSASNVVQALNCLAKNRIITKISRGIWADAESGKVSPYTIVPFLLPRQRAYVSFISALHLHGLVEQIPQVITLATLSHTKTIRTAVGVFQLHRIDPRFFDGFTWYKGTGNFLIAEPEKALIDSLYLSTRKKKQFAYFPELYFGGKFDLKKAMRWVEKIPNHKIRVSVAGKLKKMGK
ncbi:MAG: hypothetical protein Q8N91_05230 [Candidatus Omnitrophota bacterium]|nr:hypothetical protein [Candidatus Omnitrophota bacterium]